MIRNLKDEITALKQPPSTVLTTTSSTRPIVQSSRAARPSSRLMAPLPVRAHSGLAARLSKPGLASRIDAHPKADRFNNPPGNIANDVPEPDMSMPDSWESDPTGDLPHLSGH
jgi:hypothetical protein